jgi:hypothetical protein
MLICSCAVPIKDETIYVDEGASGAVQLHFLSPGKIDLTKPQWDEIRFGMACMSVNAFEDFKKEIEELCTKTPCSYKATQAIEMLNRIISLSRSMQKSN